MPSPTELMIAERERLAQEAAHAMVTQVFVTNKNAETHTDKFNGQVYVFPPKQPVAVSVAAATHMLGYRQGDKTPYLQRLGKAFDPRTFEDDPEGVRWLANFEFEEAVLQPASALQQALEGVKLPVRGMADLESRL